MAKYKIFVDTCADMDEKTAQENNIGIIRFMSVFGETAYVTGTEITNAEFYKKLEESEDIPTTSQTPYADFYETLKQASLENDTVIYFAMSSKASGQYNTACMIRNEILEEDNPNADIRIVDTMKFSVYISMAALYAKELLDMGENVDDVIKKCHEYMESWEAYILVDTLKYLEKGGRIKKSSAILGSLLDIKPVLAIRDGLIENIEKIRGRKKIYKKLIELVREHPDFDEDAGEFVVAHSSKEYCEELIENLKDEFGIDDVKVTCELGPVVGTHIGPGTVAVLFRIKK